MRWDLAPRCPEHLHQVLENLQRIYRLKGVIEEHERKWSGIIGNCIKRGEGWKLAVFNGVAIFLEKSSLSERVKNEF